ncbi:hypothetical protein [Haloterrigena salinisoli]|uniref:hypothetical protein n=1 Tax=Haloterrigena salinisoli TaxID=3132747 RepID=UPI0030CB373F
MPTQPPTPSTPDRPVPASEGRVLATTSQLAGRVEDALDCRLETSVLEDLLLELDRGDYVEWVTVTRDGEYVWDLSDAPERIGEVVAAAVMKRLEQWLATRTDE